MGMNTQDDGAATAAAEAAAIEARGRAAAETRDKHGTSPGTAVLSTSTVNMVGDTKSAAKEPDKSEQTGDKKAASVDAAHSADSQNPGEEGKISAPTLSGKGTEPKKEDDDVNMNDDEDEHKAGATKATATVEVKADADGDVVMMGPPAGKQQTPAAKRVDATVFDKLSQMLKEEVDEQMLETKGKAMAAEFFASVYKDMVKKGATAKPDSVLPATTDEQQLQLFALLKTLIADKRSSMQRVNAAVSDLVVACFRSKWTFDQLLTDRVAKAHVPSIPASTAWGKPSSATEAKSVQARLEEDMAPYRFDGAVYSAEEIGRLKSICMAQHGFAETPRKGTADEWTIIWGMMNGNILMRVLPQFLKRCCTMKQFQWLHQYMVVMAEGELYATLPTNSQVYDANQTSKRLCDAIRASMVHQNWTDKRVDSMLAKVKVVSYNKERHALHFHFFTKKEAIQWENMAIPFRNSKLELKNPDERYRETTINEDGTESILFKPPTDGARDDRYQTPYKFRLTNITRTTEIDKIAQYLQHITGNGLRIGVPVDPYGHGSDWSLVWEFFGTKSSCPPALENVNRILWREHEILVLHRVGAAYAPCHKCARIGHLEATCPTAEVDWLTECTLIVTEPDIARISTERSIWASPDEAKTIFDRLGEEDATTTGTVTSPVITEASSNDPAADTPPAETSVTKPIHLQSPIEQVTTAWKTVRANKPRRPAAGKNAPVQSNGKKTNKKKGKSKAKTHQAEGIAPVSSKTVFVETNFGGEQSDSEDSDYEDEKSKPSDKEPTGTSTDDTKTGNATPAARATAPPSPVGAKSAQEVINEAIKRSNMEKLGLAILHLAAKHRKALDTRTIAEKLADKRPDLGQKASRAWVMEALGGQVADTPATGNCQYYAMAEGLLQTAMKGAADVEVATELTMLLKFGYRLAHEVDVDKEMPISSVIAIADISQATEPAAITDYFKQLAISASDRGSVLPKELWGCTETLRMAAKLLGRRIDVIMDTQDPSAVCVLQLQPQRIRDRATKELFESAAIHQPGLEVWLQAIQQDLERGTLPIILHFSPSAQHYSAVLLHRDSQPVVEKRQTDLRDLIQKTPSVDEIIDKAKQAKHNDQQNEQNEKQGPTRLELVESQSEITTNTALATLTQSNWTLTEKKIVIDCLVQDPHAMKAMLTFWGTSSQTTSTQNSSTSATTRVESDGSFHPSSSSEEESGNYSGDGENDDDDAPYAFPSPATSREFATWARAKWQEVRTEWKEQDGTTLPLLTDQPALQAYAAKHPEEMAAAGQLFANPFRFLDHFTDDGISAWMCHRWLRHGIKAIGERLEYIVDQAERSEIREWLDQLHNATITSVKLRWWKTRKCWRILRAALPECFAGPTAVPFLDANMTMEAAFVLAIDTLLPSLAYDLQASPTNAAMTSKTLAEVYSFTPAFQTAMRQAIDQVDWAPVESFIRSLKIAPTSQKVTTRC